MSDQARTWWEEPVPEEYAGHAPYGGQPSHAGGSPFGAMPDTEEPQGIDRERVVPTGPPRDDRDAAGQGVMWRPRRWHRRGPVRLGRRSAATRETMHRLPPSPGPRLDRRGARRSVPPATGRSPPPARATGSPAAAGTARTPRPAGPPA